MVHGLHDDHVCYEQLHGDLRDDDPRDDDLHGGGLHCVLDVDD